MKKGQVLEGIVEQNQFPNKGTVITEEGKVIIKGGIPGQKVRVSIKKKREDHAEGRLVEVLEKSALEVEAPCKHFGICGGCSFLSLPYEEQLNLKEKQVRELLEKALVRQESAWEFEKIKRSPIEFGYRNKMEFTFGDEYRDGPLALGMHKSGSFYDIVSVTDCQIVDEDYRMILRATRDYFAGLQISYFHRMTHIGYLRHLLVRKAVKTGEILVALVTSSQLEVDLTPWKELLLQLPLKGKFAGILHTWNDSVADVVQSDRTDILYGQDFFYEELLGLKFKISQFSFFQTNSLGAEVLYQTARDYIGKLDKENPVVFDLYSGTGTIAQLMAPVSGKVVGVEIVEEAVLAARDNAARNGLTNCEFLAGDVLKVLDEITEKPDFIILDPPRDGIHPKALAKIINYGVERMVYISCKPTSLARDLISLEGNGYYVVKAVAVDQFPWTANVETVVLLSKQE